MSTTRAWCVVMTGEHRRYAPWGPFFDKGLAEDFAEYLTREVDPAEVRPMQDPTRDLLAWRRAVALPQINSLRGALDESCDAELARTPDNQIKPGHIQRCARQDPHFYPSQCAPREVIADAI